MLKVDIWVENFRCAGIITFAMERRKNLRIGNISNFPLSTCTLLPAKILYLQRYSTDFRKLCFSLEDVEGGHLSGKFQARSVFYLWNGKEKTLRIANISNFPLSTCTLSPAKIPYLQRYSTDFRKHWSSAPRCWRWTFGWKISGAQVLLFCNSERRKLCASTTFVTFPLSTCTLLHAKILYLQRYSTDYRKRCFSSKMVKVSIWVENFRCAGVLLLKWQGENYALRQHFKFHTFNL